MPAFRSLAALLPLALLLSAAGCAVDDGSIPDDTSPDLEALVGNAHDIVIGFNSGADSGGADNFRYYPFFFAATAHPRICHTYVMWDVALQSGGNEGRVANLPSGADKTAPSGSRPAFEYWLSQAETVGLCDEVTVSFKGAYVDSNGPRVGAVCPDGTKIKAGSKGCEAPTEKQVREAFDAFLATDWGFSGKFSFTPWNEPNNAGDAGDGLGTVIPASLAAHYWLAMENVCKTQSCEVAAGDFASNGTWWKDFEWNCANDNVANMTEQRNGGTYCVHPSDRNPGNKLEASYLDNYKDTIAQASGNGGYPHLGAQARPKVFAYHGWHDANEYVDHDQHCTDYGNCATREVLTSLGGSWGSVKIWDTEVGSSQGETLTDEEQACGAAFLLRLSAITPRIERIYYTRLHGGGGELVEGQIGSTTNPPKARAALGVLVNRKTTYSSKCK